MGSKNVQYLSMIIFMIGVGAGLIFSGVAVWADFEASMFDSSLAAEDAFPDFRCPIMIGQNQTGIISGSIENTSKYNLQFFIRAHTTSGSIITMDERIDRPVVPAGTSQPIQWEVSRSNAIWENFILFRAYQYRYAPVPSRASSCGIMVSPIPGISGAAAVGVLIGISLVGMGAGLVLWAIETETRQAARGGYRHVGAGGFRRGRIGGEPARFVAVGIPADPPHGSGDFCDDGLFCGERLKARWICPNLAGDLDQMLRLVPA